MMNPVTLLRAVFLTLIISIVFCDGVVEAVTAPTTDSPVAVNEHESFTILLEQSPPTGLADRLQHRKEIILHRSSDFEMLTSDTLDIGIPVIMGSYFDNAHIFDSSAIQEAYFGGNPTGSMTDYFDEVSYGQFQLTGQVYGPFTAPQTQSYYVDGTDYPQNFGGFAHDLLTLADPGIDFGTYDNDGPDGIPNSGDDDGIVDGIIFIYPDGSQSAGDSDNFAARFSYMWWLNAPVFVTNDARFGGGFIQIDEHCRVPAENGNGSLDQRGDIGVACHEFGHILGLPDQYDGDGTSYGIGTWCLMSTGTGGACNCIAGLAKPTHFCAWCKVYLGFVVPSVVVGTESVQIPPVETNPVIYKLWEDAYQGERYFLLENRTKSGFDADIEGEGVLIWHCNGDAAFDNQVDTFRIVDLEEADGLDDLDNKVNRMDGGDPYPGSSNNTTFSDLSYPAATDVFGDATGVTAEGFSYVSGPGSDVMVTLTQREIKGITLSYNVFGWMYAWGSSSATIRYGATRFQSPKAGRLVAVQAGLKKNNVYDYDVRIWDDIISGSPVGLHSSLTTHGTFPSVPSKRYYEIPLADSMDLDSGQVFLVDIAFGPVSYAVPFLYAHPVSQQSHYSTDGINYTPWTDKDVLIRARIATDNYVCGDADASDAVDIDDVVYLINYIFSGGPEPIPYNSGDADCSNAVDIDDVVWLISYIFSGGNAPCDTDGDDATDC